MKITHIPVNSGDSYWSIAKRLAPNLVGDEFINFFNKLGNLNGWIKLFPGQVIHVDEDILPQTPLPPVFVSHGWAEWVTVFGGNEPVLVTTEADSGPGSLREAFKTPNAHITFAPEVKTIKLLSDIISDHNVTVDGKGLVEVTHSSIKFEGRNIIVRGMKFKDCKATTNTDCITFRTKSNETKNQIFAVYNCTFDGASDGGCDVIWNRGVDVYGTIAWNTFKNIDKACLVHSGDDGYEGGHYYMTFHHNSWIDCYQRMPMARDCDLHCYDETITNYGKADGSGGGIKAARGTQLLAERIKSYPREVGSITFDGSIVTKPRMEAVGPHLSSTTGNVKCVDCDPNHVTQRNPELVMLPPYHYLID